MTALGALLVAVCVLTGSMRWAQQCRNDQDLPVDWYVLYKFPALRGHENPLIQQGLGYAFITSGTVQHGWQISHASINDSHSMPALTLAPLYTNKSTMHIVYNDEPPPSASAGDHELGHTKGVVMTHSVSFGYWLVHSVPHYPLTSRYQYPHSGLPYGQSFLCISLDLLNINLVGKQLQYNQPHIYSAAITAPLRKQLPDIDLIINRISITNPPWYHLTELRTQAGLQFLSFAKTRDFGKDLYSDWVATVLQCDMYVESWLNGPGKLPSECHKKYNVSNVEHLTWHVPGQVTFKSSTDHSKWAVSTRGANDSWICVGDINRAEHQKHRGGGTVCTNRISDLWNMYRTLVDNTEPCIN